MSNPTKCLINFCKCPPQKSLAKILLSIVLFSGIYLCLFSLDKKSSFPGNCTKHQVFNNASNNTNIETRCEGGNFLGLFVLYIIATIGGILIAYCKMPPLLGMLLMGFLLRNIPVVNYAIYIDKIWSGYLRNLALTVILIRAGLGLDPGVLKKLSFVVVRLAFTPCLVEASVEAVAAYFLLGMPWGFCFILGFVLAAVSPAVVVPSMLELERKGLGIAEGINTLVIAASSIDDVLAISGFGISMGLAFTDSSNILLKIFRGPLEALAGISYGIIVGLILWFLPSLEDKKLDFYRTIVLYVLSVGVMFGSVSLNIPGAGALGVLVLSFVSGLGWRRRSSTWNGTKNSVTDNTDVLWWLAKPFLFGLIGAGLDISVIKWNIVGYGVVTLIIGLIFRLIVSFLVVFGTDLRLKERLFIPIAWLPKATVQAAIGPVVLDYAIKNGLDDKYIGYGELIMAIAAISIILTAPIGAILISLTAPLLLRKSDIEVTNEEDVEGLKQLKIEDNVNMVQDENLKNHNLDSTNKSSITQNEEQV